MQRLRILTSPEVHLLTSLQTCAKVRSGVMLDSEDRRNPIKDNGEHPNGVFD